VSGSTAIAVGETVTVTNTGKDPVRLDLIDTGATSLDVAAGTTVTQCGQADSVGLVCMGTKSCTVAWRADKI
jgi:hypothetical protein